MNPISLITDKWIPVVCMNGERKKISPLEITDESIESIESCRPDFQGAYWQFLIGLLQTTMAPIDEDAWHDAWKDGLDPDELRKAFEGVRSVFNFGPVTPSFMQDFEQLGPADTPLVTLLPEVPGENTIKCNKDIFIKRGSVEKMCPNCAAAALFSLQLNAPSGGKGYRTGLRGGGPLTTLIEIHRFDKNARVPLWRKLWVNVMPQTESGLKIPQKFDERIFPWMGKTRISETEGSITTPEQVDHLQAYWGMPRRIRIDFENVLSGTCDICGEESCNLLTRMAVKNYGTNYSSWVHPLTPYKENPKDHVPYSVKPQPGGLLWKDWLGLNQEINGEKLKERPAQVVSLFNRRINVGVDAGLSSFGFDFDNMKARCWYEHHLPQLIPGKIIPPLVNAQKFSAGCLKRLREALSKINRPNSNLETEFWNETQNIFSELISGLESEGCQQAEPFNQFIFKIRDFSLKYFDDLVLESLVNSEKIQKIAEGRRELILSLNKMIKSCYQEAKNEISK